MGWKGNPENAPRLVLDCVLPHLTVTDGTCLSQRVVNSNELKIAIIVAQNDS